MTRAKFEGLIESQVNKTLICVEDCLEDADLITSDLDEILLIGGSSRIPKVGETV